VLLSSSVQRERAVLVRLMLQQVSTETMALYSQHANSSCSLPNSYSRSVLLR
jgi:hypothetical protein